MIHPKYKIGEKLTINLPTDKKYHDLTVQVKEVDVYDNNGLVYFLTVFDKNDKPMRVDFWLPENKLRPFKSRSLEDLVPGDVVVSPSGIEFEVLEPRSKVFFLAPVGMPSSSSYVSSKVLEADGFKIKGIEEKKESL